MSRLRDISVFYRQEFHFSTVVFVPIHRVESTFFHLDFDVLLINIIIDLFYIFEVVFIDESIFLHPCFEFASLSKQIFFEFIPFPRNDRLDLFLLFLWFVRFVWFVLFFLFVHIFRFLLSLYLFLSNRMHKHLLILV